MGKHKCFTVKGKPFYSIGVQAHNSNSSTQEYIKYVWNAANKLGANTAAVPIPWEKFEPEEGVFRESYVREIIRQARENDLKLVLLWFGTWKNGTMEYVPSWVKKDWIRFPRTELKGGKKTHNLSPHCQYNLQADQKAFCKLMEIIKECDKEEQTVIAVQIENEAGLLSATKRDFSSWGEEAFRSKVPRALIEYCEAHPESEVAQGWKKEGRKKNGSWSEIFGTAGSEWMTAWAVASYIDKIAEAGRKIYDIFFYTNAWINEGRGLAGIDWPAGTALPLNLDIYYAACRNLDTIAPDIYLPEVTQYLNVLKSYSNAENGFPLYVPESGRVLFNSGMMFEGIGDFGAIGYHVFGGESLLTDDQTALNENGVSMSHSFMMLRNVENILLDYIGTNRIYTIHRRGDEQSQLIRNLDGGWRVYVSFQGTLDNYQRMDFAHQMACQEEISGNMGEPCRGLLFQESENVFYVVGHKFRIFFLQEDDIEGALDEVKASPAIFSANAEYISVTEGYFGKDGKYVIESYRTGDEARHGTFAQWDSKVLRIELQKLV